MPISQSFDEALVKIADGINQKRRKEIIDVYANKQGFFDYIKQVKQHDVFTKGNKSKTMRKVASMPIEIDQFFSKIYGNDYFKDKNFFTHHAQEFLVVDPKKL